MFEASSIFPAAHGFFLFQFFDAAIEANSVVAGQDSAAIVARPAHPVFLEERPQAALADVFEVVEHAHPEKCPVALIQRLQMLAREFSTFVAEIDFPLGNKGAMFLQDRAILSAGSAAPAICEIDSAFLHVPGIREVFRANGAVHSAGRNERRVEGGLVLLFSGRRARFSLRHVFSVRVKIAPSRLRIGFYHFSFKTARKKRPQTPGFYYQLFRRAFLAERPCNKKTAFAVLILVGRTGFEPVTSTV
jgi:hypothetical protein